MYSGLNAKIKAMRGKFLKREDYEALCKAGTLADFGAALAERGAYGRGALEGGPEPSRHIMEQRLAQTLREDFSRISDFITDLNLKRFLEAFFLKFEINGLTVSLSPIAGLTPRAEEFLEKLRGSRLYEASDIMAEKEKPFELETHLDIYYYLRVWRLKDKYLRGTNKQVAEQLIGGEIDLKNILWINRMKRFYSVDQTFVYTHLIPIHYRLKAADINRMAKAGTRSELQEESGRTAYGKLLEDDNLDRAFVGAMAGSCRAAAREYPHSIAPVLAYIFFKDLEIKNITSVLEGVRYRLPESEILKRCDGLSLACGPPAGVKGAC